MTVPNTPTGSDAEPDPFAPPQYPEPLPARERRPLGPELKVGVLTGLPCVLLGVAVGLLWLWLAPRVMYVVSGDQILYVNPEGEERAGADSIFALLGLGAGVLTALVAFFFTRRRGGGIAVAVGLAVGGLLGSLLAWRLGMWLGPTSNVLAHAKQVGEGKPFSAELKLSAYGALLVWPLSAMIALLVVTAAFGKREPDRPPYWAGPQWDGPAAPDTTADEEQPPAAQ